MQLIGSVPQGKSLPWSHRAPSSHFPCDNTVVSNSYFTNLKQFSEPEEIQQTLSSKKKEYKRESHHKETAGLINMKEKVVKQ